DPGAMQIGETRILVVTGLAPLVMGLTQVLADALLDRRQAGGEHPLEHGRGEEGAGDLDQRQPFVVDITGFHARPPRANDAGTVKMTATGKVRSCGSA